MTERAVLIESAHSSTRPDLLQSPRLLDAGIPHAFTTRRGGVSHGVFSTLNFGNPSDLPLSERDPMTNIRQNTERVLDAIGLSNCQTIEVHQVHGGEVHVAHTLSGKDPKADAIVTQALDLVAMIRIADCAPILLASMDGTAVAAVHAGWRGVVAGVLPRAIAALTSRTTSPIIGAIGPCIGVRAFEVGEDVTHEFRRVFPSNEWTSILHMHRGRTTIDLSRSLVVQAAALGVELDTIGGCTFEDPERFFSHRRDRGRTGRLGAFIACRR